MKLKITSFNSIRRLLSEIYQRLRLTLCSHHIISKHIATSKCENMITTIATSHLLHISLNLYRLGHLHLHLYLPRCQWLQIQAVLITHLLCNLHHRIAPATISSSHSQRICLIVRLQRINGLMARKPMISELMVVCVSNVII